MAAPEFVPQKPGRLVRNYKSPPWRPDRWLAERPGDLDDLQPKGEQFGDPGPDQGYVYKLARHYEGKLTLTEGEHERDALVGAIQVALKRASIFSRAPVIHDLTIGLTVFGFLRQAPADLVELRTPLFMEVAHPHHYAEQRHIAAMVPESTLRLVHTKVTEQHAADWRSLLSL